MRGRPTMLFTALCIALAIALAAGPLYAQRTKSSSRAGEQVKAEKGIKDNRYFFYFINSSVSNFGSEQEKKLYREAILRDMISQLLYMRFSFRESYIEIRKSQKILIDVYRTTLARDIDNARKLLNTFVPSVFDSNDKDAMLYMRLGYRDLNVSNLYMGMGDNITERLYSMRLNKYVEAIKTAKHGSRYALLGMISVAESRSVKDEIKGLRKIFLAVSRAVLDAADEYDRRNLTFNTIKKKIIMYAPKDDKERYLTVHYDSYFISRDRKSFYDDVWEKAEVDTIEDFKEYKSSLD